MRKFWVLLLVCGALLQGSALAGPPKVYEILEKVRRNLCHHSMRWQVTLVDEGVTLEGKSSPSIGVRVYGGPYLYSYDGKHSTLLTGESLRTLRATKGNAVSIKLLPGFQPATYFGFELCQVDYRYACGPAASGPHPATLPAPLAVSRSSSRLLVPPPQPAHPDKLPCATEDLPRFDPPGDQRIAVDNAFFPFQESVAVDWAHAHGAPHLGPDTVIGGHKCYSLLFPDGTEMDVCRTTLHPHRLIVKARGQTRWVWYFYDIR